MPHHWFLMTFSTLSTFICLLVLVRWIGSTQMSQLTFFNWVAGASMGNLAANMIASDSVKQWSENSYELVLFTAATIAAAWVALKSRKLRRITNGEPVVLIHKGSLLRDNLKKTKVNIDILMMLLREKGYFSYEEIAYAILEPSGNLSILPSQEAQSVSKRDLVKGPDLSEKSGGPFVELVVDGEVDEDKLRTSGHDYSWLMREVSKAGAKSLKEITYLAVNQEGSVIVDSNRLQSSKAGDDNKSMDQNKKKEQKDQKET